MAILLLLVLVAFPFAEIALLIVVGQQIGLFATLVLLGLAFLAGVVLIRLQGVATLFSVRAALDRGEAPTEALFHAACVVAAGILLMIPGFLTDFMALALLSFLPFRNLVKAWLWRRAVRRRDTVGPGAAGAGASRPGAVVIEGEYETVEEAKEATDRTRPNPWRRDDGPAQPLEPPGSSRD